MATILGVISNLSLAVVIYLTYVQQGEAKQGYGVTGFLVAVFSLTGLIMGIYTAMQRDRYKFFPWLAIVLNTVAVLVIGGVVYAGVYL